MNEKEILAKSMEMGGAFILGLSIGMAVKKSIKLLLVVFGVGMLFVFFLESKGAVSINESNLNNVIMVIKESTSSSISFIETRLDNYSSSTILSAISGFFTGIKIA